MATTFTAAWKNSVINSILGVSATSITATFPYYIGAYSGAQASDPLTAPAGTFVHTGTSAVQVGTFMAAPSGGVSELSTPRSANALATLTAAFARIYTSNGTAIMDTGVSLVGGGGGVIVPTLSATNGLPFTVDDFSVKLPNANGTLMLNDALRDAIVSAVCVTAANIAACSSAAIKIYSGSAPANANMAATGTLLATFSTAAAGASWSAPVGGAAALASAIAAVASATGTAGYARLEKGAYVIQGSVGTTGTDFVIDNTSITSGGTFNLTNATISL